MKLFMTFAISPTFSAAPSAHWEFLIQISIQYLQKIFTSNTPNTWKYPKFANLSLVWPLNQLTTDAAGRAKANFKCNLSTEPFQWNLISCKMIFTYFVYYCQVWDSMNNWTYKTLIHEKMEFLKDILFFLISIYIVVVNVDCDSWRMY